jgi:hypothetical protein
VDALVNAPLATQTIGILWRGPLDSCNYACNYCPFAKREPDAKTLRRDREALARFVEWVQRTKTWCMRILITPYGEALIWPWYREALAELSHSTNVHQISIQTNGSAPVDFLDRAEPSRLSLWVSYHPSQVSLARFVARVELLHARGTALSVGMVVTPDRSEEAEALRAQLPATVPMWLNAQRPGPRWRDDEVDRLRRIDPAFHLEASRNASRGLSCRSGEDVISVDGAGVVRRCHFVDRPLGNLYTDELASLLKKEVCPRATCDCWLGYAQLDHLGVREAHGEARFLARMALPLIDGGADR